MLRPITRWLSDDDLKRIYTSDYWNNIEAEKKKEWWIAGGDYSKCLQYLESKGLLRQYSQVEPSILELADSSGRPLIVADIAAGIGWSAARLSRLDAVGEVLAVELSEHRLDGLFEHAVKMMDGRPSKISRFLGSFYDLKFQDRSVDLIFLSQAFHHADNPIQLLSECDRVLRPNGRMIIIGEHFVGSKQIVRAWLSNLLKRRRFITKFATMFPPDPVLGDHYYRVRDYYSMFKAANYRLRHHWVDSSTVAYVADKSGVWTQAR